MDEIEKNFLDTWLKVHLSLYGGNNELFDEWCEKKSIPEDGITYLKLKFIEEINNRDRYVVSIRKAQVTLNRVSYKLGNIKKRP